MRILMGCRDPFQARLLKDAFAVAEDQLAGSSLESHQSKGFTDHQSATGNTSLLPRSSNIVQCRSLL